MQAFKKYTALFLLLLLPGFSVLQAAPRYPFDSEKQSQLFYHLTGELRCLVCANESLQDSNAPLAEDLRQEIYQKIQQGQTEAQILADLKNRYGSFILFTPPWSLETVLLWCAPFLFMSLGGWLLWRYTRKKNA